MNIKLNDLTKFEKAFVDTYPDSIKAIVANRYYHDYTCDEWGSIQTWTYKDWTTGRVYKHTELSELGQRFEGYRTFKTDFNEFLK